MGLIARELEAKGLSTITITLMQGISSKVRPPRAVLVRFPLGRVTGATFDLETQKEVVKSALQALKEIQTPGEIEELPFKWKNK